MGPCLCIRSSMYGAMILNIMTLSIVTAQNICNIKKAQKNNLFIAIRPSVIKLNVLVPYNSNYFCRVSVHQIVTKPNSFSVKIRTNKTNGGGLAPSSQTIGSMRTPWLAKPAGKIDSAKLELDEPCVYANYPGACTIAIYLFS
jgi:hypothetical protein